MTISNDMHDQGIAEEFRVNYEKLIAEGENFCKTKNVAIVSIARNVEKNLENNIKTLEYLGSLFNNAYFYVYENDSIDSTPTILKNWEKRNARVKVECEKLDTPYLPLSTSTIRTHNMAKARNRCIAYAATISDKIDYIIVIDIDFVAMSLKGFYNSFGWLCNVDYIDAIAGFSFLMKKPLFPNNTTTKHEMLTNYDSWAYRHNWWSDTQQAGLMYWFQWWIPLIGSPLIKVNSAFGGYAIYKKDFYLSGKYDGANCEHVLFHKYIYDNKPNFNLFVNPSQIMYVEI